MDLSNLIQILPSLGIMALLSAIIVRYMQSRHEKEIQRNQIISEEDNNEKDRLLQYSKEVAARFDKLLERFDEREAILEAEKKARAESTRQLEELEKYINESERFWHETFTEFREWLHDGHQIFNSYVFDKDTSNDEIRSDFENKFQAWLHTPMPFLEKLPPKRVVKLMD